MCINILLLLNSSECVFAVWYFAYDKIPINCKYVEEIK